MSTSVLIDGAWEAITGAAQRRNQRAWVAVAFFGKDGPNLLPLATESRLVVNASEAAVKQGLTHPASLSQMVDNGVLVYSVENLHAKVFVFGATAFVGSADATGNSAEVLVQAVIRTTERSAVAKAREFVDSQCGVELGPAELDRLQKLYRPPKFHSDQRRGTTSHTQRKRSELRRLHLAHLERLDPPEESEQVNQDGRKDAKTRMEQPRRHELTDFHWCGRCPFRERDQVIQLTTEASGKVLVSPPATVISTRKWSIGRAPRFSFG